eukprot:CAMPEP_0113552530 /NCGR_PEP_ID=MMETSP0015_2-20120614/15116_1 /TAXON_ID=2838 /ORGANISM="Odontella" /LENGTH=351 /DNA_ID=CAMNT_0000453513 /DNA_START=58 /DNA_END=1113 /DNA_ORIENTATION=+ /assembly_acc=CAM_ASM_000160
MTTAALAWGCAFIAFSPSVSLLFLLAYRKAQLVIVVTTSAFAFLLSSLLASLFWLAVPASHRSNPLALVPPAVVCQFILRCGFVHLYHRVESVIQKSIRKHERHEAEQAERRRQREGGGSSSPSRGSPGSPTENRDATSPSAALSETARLRLELNDWACGLASGTGFGGMHAILLFGTLLASESGQVGTLYQDSCPGIPSLVNSATMAFLFSVLDIFIMLLTFYGMRRRRDGTLARGGGEISLSSYSRDSRDSGGPSVLAGRAPCIPRFSDSKNGGNAALFTAFISHLAAGFATTPNLNEGGCLVALPVLAGVVAGTALLFVGGCSGHYLPDSQNRRSEGRVSSSFGVHED